MKYSTFHINSKNQFTKIILQASISFCLALLIGIAQVDSAQAASGRTGDRDTTAPTVPSGLTGTATSSSQINLSWKASTDTVGVKGYKVFQSGTQIATVTGTSYSKTGLTASMTYTYTVSAYDTAGNTSSQSKSVSATTQGTGGSTGGGTNVSGVPAGIYSIDKVVDKPFVDGVLIRVYWSQVEKTEGTYDFSQIADVIQQAEALGQSVTIATMAMAAPTWLESKSQTFNHPEFGLTIVPWDQTMLSALQKLATAISTYKVDGVALKDHPTVKQVDAAIGGVQSIRLTQLPSGYTAAKFEDAVFTSVRTWANAFPNKYLYVGLFGVSDGATNPTTAENLRDGLLAEFDGNGTPRVNFFQEVLTGSAPNGELGNIAGAVKNDTSIMLQACGEWKNKSAWSWCTWLNNDSPSAGLSHGFNDFNTTYFEIYEADLLNSAYATQFQQWHDTLLPYIQ